MSWFLSIRFVLLDQNLNHIKSLFTRLYWYQDSLRCGAIV